MPYNRIARRIDDPGLQPERTSLAWFRTLFVIIAIAILFLKLAMVNQNLILLSGSIILLISNLGCYAYAYKRSLLDTKHAAVTSYGSVVVKRIICCSIIFSAFVFSMSHIARLLDMLTL